MKTTNTLSPTVPLTPSQLRDAADLAEQIESLQGELNALLTGGIVMGSKSSAPASTGKRRFSPAVRARIAAGQKASWARRNAAKVAVASQATAPAPAPAPAAPTAPAPAAPVAQAA